MSDVPGKKRLAPRFYVPEVPIVSVEHPCMVQNVDKAIRMLGGDNEIADSLDPENDKPLGLRFQPEDATSREVVSYNKRTNNLLLKVTVAKRTGKKRKRGSDDEFSEDPEYSSTRKDSGYLLQSMTDNPHFGAEIVGLVHSTHIWRTMPDFVYSSKGSVFLNEVKTKFLSQDYPKLKQWSLPRTLGSASVDTEAIPPPVLSMQTLPYSYAYNQNPASKAVTARQTPRDTGTPAEVLPEDGHHEQERPVDGHSSG
ncbi:tau 95 subunit of transcription factor TFIIIC [Cladophialophora chaetospira]|uniref:Tau 95 subunit of transcription factor TFIIIC n=1 Tax=Cladophialophora chaetospira TaxID=386627 RepID=A0AA39CDX0_9EURO|nr:tau 95 subunit of transcription factor TFIIIC [Cladophialophora chaetospira]